MKTEKIKITCEGASTLDYKKLSEFQGNLKSLDSDRFQALKKQILTLGFSEPISVWKNKNKNFILNGHQRLRVIKTLVEEENFECPPLPVNWVEAANIKEAKLKVLSLASQFGKVEDQGLYEFMVEFDIPPTEVLESLSFPDLDMKHFISSYFDGWENDLGSSKVENTEANLDGIISIVKVSCPQEKKEKLVAVIEKVLPAWAQIE